MTEYNICPIAKPRMTRRDQWLKPPRSPVKRYYDFCLQCKLEKVVLPCYGANVTFVLPIPSSMSNKKKKALEGRPHMKRPDLDNLLKALGDSLYQDDSGIYDIHVRKIWGLEGKIIIEDVKEV
jgi:Holliday junction resolvase RusA-like endonuclease